MRISALLADTLLNREESMSSTIVMGLFACLFLMAVVWLGLVMWMFRRLRLRHPSTYESIGSPSLFWNNSMRNNWLFLKFLFGSPWPELGDSQLSIVARMMQVMLIVYMVGFAVCVLLFVVTEFR